MTSRPSPPSILFSASETVHQPGDFITGDAKFYSYLEGRVAAAATATTGNPLEIRSRQLVKNTYDMERLFHDACPVGRVSRKTARFACSSLEDCLVYASKQYSAPFYVYEVEMPDAVAAPMALAGHARKIIEQDLQRAEAMAAEYWEPKHTWHYWEYLGGGMTVLKDGLRFIPPVALDQEAVTRKKLYDEDAANAASVDWLAGSL